MNPEFELHQPRYSRQQTGMVCERCGATFRFPVGLRDFSCLCGNAFLAERCTMCGHMAVVSGGIIRCSAGCPPQRYDVPFVDGGDEAARVVRLHEACEQVEPGIRAWTMSCCCYVMTDATTAERLEDMHQLLGVDRPGMNRESLAALAAVDALAQAFAAGIPCHAGLMQDLAAALGIPSGRAASRVSELLLMVAHGLQLPTTLGRYERWRAVVDELSARWPVWAGYVRRQARRVRAIVCTHQRT